MDKILKFILITIFYSSSHFAIAENYDDKIMAVVNDRISSKLPPIDTTIKEND